MIPLFAVHSPVVDLMEPLRQTLASGQLAEGPKVKEFEAALAAALFPAGTAAATEGAVRRVLATNSCTSALHMAYKLAGVGPGTAVVAPAMSCFASYAPILELGGEIIWTDVEPDSGNLNYQSVRLDSRVRAVLLVYWGGCPLTQHALSTLRTECARQGVKLIIDAAHAIGIASPHLPPEAYCCLSFQAIKTINTIGDGGALIVPAEDFERARKMRWFGLDRERVIDPHYFDGRVDQDIPEHGLKWHMNDVAATTGLVQLQYLKELVEKQRDNATFYTRAFAGTLLYDWAPPQKGASTYWLYTLVAPDRRTRDALRVWLYRAGIQASQVHARCDKHTCMSKFRRPRLPGTDKFDSCALCIPNHASLTPEERQYIAEQVIAFSKASWQEREAV